MKERMKERKKEMKERKRGEEGKRERERKRGREGACDLTEDASSPPLTPSPPLLFPTLSLSRCPSGRDRSKWKLTVRSSDFGNTVRATNGQKQNN